MQKQPLEPIWLPPSNLPRIVVIGAGFAGISFIQKLKGKLFQVVLLDKNNYHQFQPLLYQVATSGLEPDSITFPVRKLFKNQPNFLFRVAEVIDIDSVNNRLHTDVGYIDFKYLVIATGASTNFYGLQSVKKHGIGLKSINDAINIRSLMLQNLEQAAVIDDEAERAALTSIVIVGGGPAGVEMAGAMAEFCEFILPTDYPYLTGNLMQVYLIEAGGQLLSAMSKKSSNDTKHSLEKMGVKIMLETGVKNYDGSIVDLGDNRTIKTSTLIWTAGVAGSYPKGLVESEKLPGNRLGVNTFNQVNGYKHIFAIGDVGSMVSEEFPRGHPMVAPAAIQQGDWLSKNLIRAAKNKEMLPFRYKDKGALATIGRKRAVADFNSLHLRGFFAWIIWSTVHLLSIIGFKNKILVGINWLASYLTQDKGNRLIIRKYDKNSLR